MCHNGLLNYCISGVYMKASSTEIRSSAASFSNAPANESWSRLLQNLGFGAPMSRICRTLSQIRHSRTMSLRPAIDLWQLFYGFWHSALFSLRLTVVLCQQLYRFWYLEWLCVSIILEADLNSQASIILQGDIHTLTWVHKLTWLDRLTPQPG